MLEFSGNINLDDYILIDIEDVLLSNEYETYDIEIEEVNCFEARNPNSGFSSISHNSALISLSNLSDDRMRHAKAGAWWEANPQRALSNNSAVYTEKPDVGIYMKEWQSIYESKSGERGIFSREAAKKVVERNGRRNTNHDFGCNPCSEIILRPYQFCNLSEVIVRSDDTEASIKQKIKIATILGTFQSTLTSFPYLRKIWTKNTEEERLLGVSLTGIYDSPLTSSLDETIMKKRLEEFKQVAIDVNKEWADKLGINQSAAITAVKPSGTISQLTDSASGIHPRHSKYYIRRVRADNKDPLKTFLKSCGIPHEPDIMKIDSTTVFSFPIAAPDNSIDRDQVDAISHLNLWLLYQRYWCEHKPSVTISVDENEWPRVGAWVWDHFDEVSGVSFLPYDGGSYKQAPYESISKAEYEEFYKLMPKKINWEQLVEFTDNVEGSQTLACTAGNCDI